MDIMGGMEIENSSQGSDVEEDLDGNESVRDFNFPHFGLAEVKDEEDGDAGRLDQEEGREIHEDEDDDMGKYFIDEAPIIAEEKDAPSEPNSGGV